MRVIYNDLLPFKGYVAMMFLGVVLARRSYRPLSRMVLNHEEIHRAQARDCRVWAWYYVKYLFQCVRHGYSGAPFEREAYEHMRDLSYLETRKEGAWRAYL